MRKQVQKGRCTKLMLDKCKSVCCLYDKVQIAAAKMLNSEPSIYQFECNVPLCNAAVNDVNLPAEPYTSDFLIFYDDGHKAVREAVYRAHLSRPSVAERLDISRRYWAQHGIEDWASSSTRRAANMKTNDLRVTESGEHIRVLLQMDSESYVVDCQHFRVPYAVSQAQLAKTEQLQTEDYTIFVLDEDISTVQREVRDCRLALIQPLMDDACIYDKRHRNVLLREILAQNSVNRRTVLLYLWRYWVYQSKNALLPQERTTKEARALTADERIFRWALNKFFYTPQRQSLQTAYKMMLQAKYCDVRGRLLPQRPTFWQFRYFYRQHRDPINETISRQGIKAYQRNYRPITGSVSDYATTIGTFMTDATVADIYIVSRLSRKPIGRPVIYTMVDAYSRLITGIYVGLEGGQYALRLLCKTLSRTRSPSVKNMASR